MRIREPWPLARTRQRRREFAAAFRGVPAGGLGEALELGAGDGVLASMLTTHCRSFTATDSYRSRLALATGAGPRRVVCDATALPFVDGSFDFIFSSSVLEHVRDRALAFTEMRRCLRPRGLMMHIMPSRTWKLLQLLFYYPHLVLGAIDIGLDRLGTRKVGPTAPKAPATCDRWSDARTWRLSLKTILQGALPRVHGEFAHHIAEWRGFGCGAWRNELEAAGFRIHRVLLLPLYSGYGFGLDRLRGWGERARLSSHNAFIVTRDGDVPPPRILAWFDGAPVPALALA